VHPLTIGSLLAWLATALPFLAVLGSAPQSAPAPILKPRTRPYRRLFRWALALGITGAVVAAGFIPYPYHAGGAFMILPMTRVEVRTELEGLVEAVLVHEGEWVEAGQPIARLSLRVHERNLEAAQGQLDEARAQLLLLEAGPTAEEVESAETAVRTAQTAAAWSRARADRYVQLRKDHLVSDQDFENALRQRDVDAQALEEARANLNLVSSGARKEQLEALRAQVKSLQAVADNYKTDVAHTTVTSPISGHIVTPRIEELAGTYLKPGQRDLIAEIEDGRTVRAEVEVPEEDIADVKVGSEVTVVTWAFHQQSFKGKVARIAPVAAAAEADAQTAVVDQPGQGPTPVQVASSDRAVRVITEIPNPDGLLKSDMTGYAKIATGPRPVWDVLLRPFLRWCMVEVWYWIP
jgi:putative peptide zinc metalloprotease protein